MTPEMVDFLKILYLPFASLERTGVSAVVIEDKRNFLVNENPVQSKERFCEKIKNGKNVSSHRRLYGHR